MPLAIDQYLGGILYTYQKPINSFPKRGSDLTVFVSRHVHIIMT